MLFNVERIGTVEKFYQLFLFLLINMSLGFIFEILGYIRVRSIQAMPEVCILIVVRGLLLQLGQVASNLNIVGWGWYFELRLLVDIVLCITVEIEMLDTTHWRIRNIIKYLILILRISQEVFIDQSLIVNRVNYFL